MARNPERIETPATRARQGRAGVQMMWVLVGSIVLATIVLFIVWMAWSGELRSVQHRPAPAPAHKTRPFHLWPGGAATH